jgi:hypothetical protein
MAHLAIIDPFGVPGQDVSHDAPPSVDGVINPKKSNLLGVPGLLRREFSLGDWFSWKLFSQRPHPLHAEDSATTK